MTHIHVVTWDNRHLYGNELQQYFRLRHEIFVEERGQVTARQVMEAFDASKRRRRSRSNFVVTVG